MAAGDRTAGDELELALAAAIARAGGSGCPDRLGRALRHAVFPGGKRMRPRLALAVAAACGGSDRGLAMAAAVAVELLHCASLVHDDLPCFDDAAVRRGQPSVHAAFGEPIGVLAGDALIVLAFETIALAPTAAPRRLALVAAEIARAVGAPAGITAGQAWESEPSIDLEAYHRAKTAALFAGAAAAGAASAGARPDPWRGFGDALGMLFQTADDVLDAAGDPAHMGKPVGRDAALARPSALDAGGLEGAWRRAERQLAIVSDSIPDCPGREAFRTAILSEAARLMSRPGARAAA